MSEYGSPPKLTQEKLWEFIQLGDADFDLEQLRNKFKISAQSSVFYTGIARLVDERKIKRLGRGRYRRVTPVGEVEWWADNICIDPLPFHFPVCREDQTEFGLESVVEVFPGNLILITGRTNYGKTTMALNILAENLNLFTEGAVLMGSEYTASDGKISPQFKRRMVRMDWANWMVDGKPRFTLLPVGGDYEDYIEPDHLNVIDWISLPGEYYMIDSVMKSIKDRLGNGVGVVVTQKNNIAEFGEGGERSERYADVVMRIDAFGNESMMTLGKVKSPKGKATGRMWGFNIVDFGANFHNIREIVKCPKCWGKGWIKSGVNNIPCEVCQTKKFIDKPR